MTYCIRNFFLASLLCIATACTPDDGDAHETPPQDKAGPTNRVDIPPSVQSNLGITFAPVERRRVASTTRIPGAFELEPLARQAYRMALPGTVDLLVNQYQSVEAGQALFRYRSPQWPELQHEIIQGEQDIDATAASIEVFRATLKEANDKLGVLERRLEALAASQLRQADLETEVAAIRASIPRLQAELKQAEIAHRNAQRTLEHALHRAASATSISEDRLSAIVEHNGKKTPAYRLVDWIEVQAIRPGIIETLAVTDGMFVDSSTLVLSSVDPTQTRFRAMALQSDLALFSNGIEAHIVPPLSQQDADNNAVPADVTIGLEASPEQRTITLLAAPAEQRPWIRPGVSAFLEIVVAGTDGPALAIPRAAVVKDGIEYVFFRRDPSDPNKAIRVEADMGVSDGRWVVINSGLSLNDQVVLNGAYELKLATQQSGTAQKGGHFHADGTFHADDDDH